jgi:transposase
MQALLKAQINKTDRNDARSIAQKMRVELYRPVHVKTLRSQKLRMLLTHRKLLQSKAIVIENDLRGVPQLRSECGHCGDGEVRGTHQ